MVSSPRNLTLRTATPVPRGLDDPPGSLGVGRAPAVSGPRDEFLDAGRPRLPHSAEVALSRMDELASRARVKAFGQHYHFSGPVWQSVRAEIRERLAWLLDGSQIDDSFENVTQMVMQVATEVVTLRIAARDALHRLAAILCRRDGLLDKDKALEPADRLHQVARTEREVERAAARGLRAFVAVPMSPGHVPPETALHAIFHQLAVQFVEKPPTGDDALVLMPVGGSYGEPALLDRWSNSLGFPLSCNITQVIVTHHGTALGWVPEEQFHNAINIAPNMPPVSPLGLATCFAAKGQKAAFGAH